MKTNNKTELLPVHAPRNNPGRLVYLASPFGANPRLCKLRATQVGRLTYLLQSLGHNVISPVLHGVAALEKAKEALPGPIPADWYYTATLELLHRCDHLWVVMLFGWKTSVGVNKEISSARERGMPIFYVDMAANFYVNKFY